MNFHYGETLPGFPIFGNTRGQQFRIQNKQKKASRPAQGIPPTDCQKSEI
jgi:hypothetical protein